MVRSRTAAAQAGTPGTDGEDVGKTGAITRKNYANAPDSTTAHASPNPSPYALDTTPGLR